MSNGYAEDSLGPEESRRSPICRYGKKIFNEEVRGLVKKTTTRFAVPKFSFEKEIYSKIRTI
jgi:hypothetical protein